MEEEYVIVKKHYDLRGCLVKIEVGDQEVEVPEIVKDIPVIAYIDTGKGMPQWHIEETKMPKEHARLLYLTKLI